MRPTHLLLGLLLSCVVAPLASAQPTSKSVSAASREMKAMFEADQAARVDPAAINWAVLTKEDEARRARTKQLLDAGALTSGDDFVPNPSCWPTR